MFNEQTLKQEIANHWGEHGAHMDVYNMLLRTKNDLGAKIKEWEGRYSRIMEEAWNTVGKERSQFLAQARELESNITELRSIIEL